jgi:hypothetical protein
MVQQGWWELGLESRVRSSFSGKQTGEREAEKS